MTENTKKKTELGMVEKEVGSPENPQIQIKELD
jgi:hypothetical protein